MALNHSVAAAPPPAGRAATTGLFPRAEIAVRSHSLQPDLALFGADTAAGLARLVGERPLEAQLETRIRRRRVLLQQGRSQIELVFDEGGIVAGDRTVALADVELNLKAGEEARQPPLASCRRCTGRPPPRDRVPETIGNHDMDPLDI
ncbi:hypothetical protein ATER59S_00704 [Aquamicrobium terrae]